jgi:hypothetical protein
MKNNNMLIAPKSYWLNTNPNTPTYINGCGGQGLTSSIVPDSLFGLSINEACNIHDHMYEQGIDKTDTDNTFLKNMITLVNQDSSSNIFKYLRKAKAHLYFLGVKIFGNIFFKQKSKRKS